MGRREVFDSYNAAYAQELYERFLSDPTSVDEGWRSIFAIDVEEAGLLPVTGTPGVGTPVAAAGLAGERPESGDGVPAARLAAEPAELRATRAAAELVDAYRLAGHYAARLDPLGGEPRGHPILEPEFHHLAPSDLEEGPAAELIADVLGWLRSVYTGTIGYEFEHLQDPARREWLRDRIESGEHLHPLSAEEKRRLLTRLSEVESLEQFLHRAYLGQKRFSIEGLDMMVPILDMAVERTAASGGREVVLGMAHRGRLNVLAHVLGRPYSAIIAEFEGRRSGSGTGDVKYHLGAEGTYATASGEPLTVTLAPNPSHLEYVDPVVEGIARAKQEDRGAPRLRVDERAVRPILIHGDAAFSAQGVVAETLNLAELDGYRTGGTLHIIANNQVGFTTRPEAGRSTHYSSDLARGFDVPIFHVNADDPEACLAVARLAHAYLEQFHGDVVVDLVGYRRFGHNEGDEPAYTQPLMYEVIADHPTVRQIWLDRLLEEDVVTEEEGSRIWDQAYDALGEAQNEVRGQDSSDAQDRPIPPRESPLGLPEAPTSVKADLLEALDAGIHRWPDDFSPHPKLIRQLQRRARTLEEGGGIDWAHAETLAFASLLAEGVPIRLTGQDTERGTFSQRHLVLHDVRTGDRYAPIEHLPDARAPMQVFNSPLSEVGTLGFEYGYSTVAEDALTVWEAQFGDFVNAAQVIVDQFIAAGYEKWGQQTGVVLLLPHGYEGQGPEHSSARLERFLQLAAEGNLRVSNCSSPAQYFHLLRRQALGRPRRSLVVFTPKSLLRHPKAVSTREEFSGGAFEAVLDDRSAADRRNEVTRIVFCSGKVYYDLAAGREEEHDAEEAGRVALIRVELLYPFPAEELRRILSAYPNVEEWVWAQEEPANMGAWSFVRGRIAEILGGGRMPFYVGRPERASPAEGYANAHQAEQRRIVREALGGGVAAHRSG